MIAGGRVVDDEILTIAQTRALLGDEAIGQSDDEIRATRDQAIRIAQATVRAYMFRHCQVADTPDPVKPRAPRRRGRAA